MKTLVFSLALVLVALTSVPAQAYGEYWVTFGFSWPQELVAGPFDSYTDCAKVAQTLNSNYLTYKYRCIMK